MLKLKVACYNKLLRVLEDKECSREQMKAFEFLIDNAPDTAQLHSVLFWARNLKKKSLLKRILNVA